jgi:glycosyltransferase involved in cell wall biosynthesis
LRSATRAHPVRLSACLIVKDEEDHLPDCLASVAFCDEIVVVDSGSTDRTVDIARAAGAMVIEHPWRGFAAQRNIALDAAHGEWALEVDADERVSPRLREEIRALVESPPAGVDNAVLPLRQIFLGVPLGASALYPTGRTRLIRRDRYRHDERRSVHEGLWPAGPSAYLSGDLEHILAETWRDSIRDIRAYARLEADQIPPTNLARAALFGVIARPIVKFVYRAGLLGGWRDGTAGLAKIALDCLYDVLTWTRYIEARRDRGGEPASRDTSAPGHFGRVVRYSGPVRMIAVARGRGQSAAARDWLERARAKGADVALITDAPPERTGIRTIEISRMGPLEVLRALATEDQHNPIEVLVLPALRARRMSRLLPGHLRGLIAPVSLHARPSELIGEVLAQRAGR